MIVVLRRGWAVLVGGLFTPAATFASSYGSGALEWESPLAKVSSSIKGPVAFAISLLAIVVCGATLVWGGEISDFVRRLVMLVLVISLIVFAGSLLQSLFGVGALL